MVISDHWSVMLLLSLFQGAMNWTHITWWTKLKNGECVLTAPLTNHFPISLLLLYLPISWDKILLKLGQLNYCSGKKMKQSYCWNEKLWVVWIEDPTNHNFPLSQSLIQTMVMTLFNFLKAERDDELQEKNLKLAEVDSWGLRKEVISITYKCKVKHQVLM